MKHVLTKLYDPYALAACILRDLRGRVLEMNATIKLKKRMKVFFSYISERQNKELGYSKFCYTIVPGFKTLLKNQFNSSENVDWTPQIRFIKGLDIRFVLKEILKFFHYCNLVSSGNNFVLVSIIAFYMLIKFLERNIINVLI